MVANRWLQAAAILIVMRDPHWFANVAIYPLRDLLGGILWVGSYAGDRFYYRGKIYVLKSGGRVEAGIEPADRRKIAAEKWRGCIVFEFPTKIVWTPTIIRYQTQASEAAVNSIVLAERGLLALGLFGLVTSTVFLVLVILGALRFLKSAREEDVALARTPAFLPPVSILWWPLHGAEVGLEGNLRSFFEQDYFEHLGSARRAFRPTSAASRELNFCFAPVTWTTPAC